MPDPTLAAAWALASFLAAYALYRRAYHHGREDERLHANHSQPLHTLTAELTATTLARTLKTQRTTTTAILLVARQLTDALGVVLATANSYAKAAGMDDHPAHRELVADGQELIARAQNYWTQVEKATK